MFIGGRNRLYQLSPDLDIVATAITGPRNDSKDCSQNECTQNLTRKLTDNINKVLLIDYSTSRLITCGSLFQGICSVRSLQNISSSEQDIVEAIVANSESESSESALAIRMFFIYLFFNFIFHSKRFSSIFRRIDSGIYCSRTTTATRYKCDVRWCDICRKFSVSK